MLPVDAAPAPKAPGPRPVRYCRKPGSTAPMTTARAIVARPPLSALITGVVSEPTTPDSREPS
ncbi:MAG TPA: hypothetical protein VI365_02395 [Trebonia sp.]